MKFKVGDWVRLNIEAREFNFNIKCLPLGVGIVTDANRRLSNGKSCIYLIEVRCANFICVFSEDELIP